MAKGISLHLGLNKVDPKHYAGWDGELMACEADARDMADIARSRKYATKILLTKSATRASLAKGMSQAAAALKSGDIFFLTYSGHGGQLPDLNADEPDGLDETWCLYDGELVDDELFTALGKFAAGVRILVLSDSCHSGSVVKLTNYLTQARADGFASHADGPFAPAGSPPRFRAMPPQVALRTYEAHRKLYDPILKRADTAKAMAKVNASVLLISGCQDNQLSSDGTFNGLFTGTLKRVWNGAKFGKDYRAFHKGIVRLMPPSQTPNYFKVGRPSAAFEGQIPFSV
jgi:hypothetical protein